MPESGDGTPEWGELSRRDRWIAGAAVAGLAATVVAAMVGPVLLVLLVGARVWPGALQLDGWMPAVVAAAGIALTGLVVELLAGPLEQLISTALPGPAGHVAVFGLRVLITAAVALLCLRLTPGTHLHRDEFPLLVGLASPAADAGTDWFEARRNSPA